MIIRQETEADYKAIYELNQQAFGQDNESQLIEKIRSGNTFIPGLSIIAELEGKIIGHILFSKIEIQGSSTFPSLALAPMAVHPDFQKKGVGSRLVKQGLEVAKKLGFEHVIVLGHENYYPKFGFHNASNWNIQCPFEVPDNVFMAIELKEGSLEGKSGTVVYPSVFLEV